MKKGVLISVIIPHYKQSKYLIDALKSLNYQSLKPDEIIVIDDGSDKKEVKRLKELKNKFKFNLILQKNYGQTYTKNRGVKLAKGKYISCLDADDKLSKNYFLEAVKVLKKNKDVGFVYCWTQLFGNEKKIVKQPKFDSKDFLNFNPVPSASLFRKKCWKEVGRFHERKIEGYEDWDFWLMLIEAGYKGFCINKPCFKYRKHGKSRNTRSKKNVILIYEILRLRHPNLFKEKILPPIRLLIEKKILAKYLNQVFFRYLNFWSLYYLIKAVWKKLLGIKF